MSCKWKCEFNQRKCNSNQKWNTHKCWCECKNQKNIICAPCSCKNGKYLGSIIDDSIIFN